MVIPKTGVRLIQVQNYFLMILKKYDKSKSSVLTNYINCIRQVRFLAVKLIVRQTFENKAQKQKNKWFLVRFCQPFFFFFFFFFTLQKKKKKKKKKTLTQLCKYGLRSSLNLLHLVSCRDTFINNSQMSRDTTFPTILYACLVKTDQPAHPRSLIRVFAGTLWIAKDPERFQADSEDPDQPARMHRLIWVFAGRTCNLVGNAGHRLKCNGSQLAKMYFGDEKFLSAFAVSWD